MEEWGNTLVKLEGIILCKDRVVPYVICRIQWLRKRELFFYSLPKVFPLNKEGKYGVAAHLPDQERFFLTCSKNCTLLTGAASQNKAVELNFVTHHFTAVWHFLEERSSEHSTFIFQLD